MKKSIVLSALFAVILIGIWFGMDKSSVNTLSNDELGSATTTLSKGNDEVPENIPEKKDSALESEALRIIARPVTIKVPLSDSAKNLALEKIKESSDLIRANYNYTNPWYDLGAYRKMIGDYDGAIQAWAFVSKIRPDDFVSLSNLGDLYAFTLGNYSKAEEYFLGSIAREPRNVDAYIQIAAIYEYHDTPKLSLTEPLLLNGISANPQDINIKIALARYYRKIGNLESARLYFEKALELSPGNTALKEELESLGN